LLDVFVTFCILEQRKLGLTPAVESIRIARETDFDKLAAVFFEEQEVEIQRSTVN
jgi:hypothetical protein